ADVRRRRRVPGRVRAPRLVQRLRARPRGGGPRPGPSSAGAGGEPRVAGGHSPVVPVRLPCGGRRRRLSLGTGRLGVLTACWVRAEFIRHKGGCRRCLGGRCTVGFTFKWVFRWQVPLTSHSTATASASCSSIPRT